MQQNSNLTEEDIKALQELNERDARETKARFLIRSHGCNEDFDISFEKAVEIVMDALKSS